MIVYRILIFLCFTIVLRGESELSWQENWIKDLESGFQSSFQTQPLSKKINGFSIYNLGLNKEDLWDTFLSGSDFFYPYLTQDISLFSEGEERIELDSQNIIELEGKNIIQKAVFYFNENNILNSISLFLDPQKIDFLYIINKLKKKYGQWTLFYPSVVYWKDVNQFLSINRKLELRYVLSNLSNIEDEQENKLNNNKEEIYHDFWEAM